MKKLIFCVWNAEFEIINDKTHGVVIPMIISDHDNRNWYINVESTNEMIDFHGMLNLDGHFHYYSGDIKIPKSIRKDNDNNWKWYAFENYKDAIKKSNELFDRKKVLLKKQMQNNLDTMQALQGKNLTLIDSIRDFYA